MHLEVEEEIVLICKSCYFRFGAALSGEPKNKEGSGKNRPCLKFPTKGGNEFGRFPLPNACFLSEAGIALNFLLPFGFKAKRKSGSQGWKPLFKILIPDIFSLIICN
jgi:hypothetical protein